MVVGKSSQGGSGTGESEEEGRRNGGRERGEEGRREDSPVSSPSSGYNSSGPGGNGEVGGREAEEEDMGRGAGKHLCGLEEERGGLEEQLLIDLSSPGEEGEGTPATWEGVKLVMPESSSQEESETPGKVGQTERYESLQQRESSIYSVGNHSTHCCHHSSCHTRHNSYSHKHSHRCQVREKEKDQVKPCHNATCQSSAAILWAGCQRGESQPKQPSHQNQKMDRDKSSPGPANEIQGSPGIQTRRLNKTQDMRSEKEIYSRRTVNTSRRVGPDPSPSGSTCSQSPSRRPGWTDFSDDEDLNFTRWESN